MHGLLELSFLGIMAVTNSPFPKPAPVDVIPNLRWELHPARVIFVGGDVSSRCKPIAWNRFNPQTALWSIEAGVWFHGLTFKIGHQSEHGIDERVSSAESRDYIGATYRVTF